MTSDDDLRSPRDIEYEICSSYELEIHDRLSIKEIAHMLDDDTYREKKVLHDHMYFLEHLMHRLEVIRLDEVTEGFPTFDLDRSLHEIRELFRRLKLKMIEFDS